MKLFNYIDTAKKFAGQSGSIAESACPDNKVQFALEASKRLAEAQLKETPSVPQLRAHPIAN